MCHPLCCTVTCGASHPLFDRIGSTCWFSSHPRIRSAKLAYTRCCLTLSPRNWRKTTLSQIRCLIFHQPRTAKEDVLLLWWMKGCPAASVIADVSTSTGTLSWSANCWWWRTWCVLLYVHMYVYGVANCSDWLAEWFVGNCPTMGCVVRYVYLTSLDYRKVQF